MIVAPSTVDTLTRQVLDGEKIGLGEGEKGGEGEGEGEERARVRAQRAKRLLLGARV